MMFDYTARLKRLQHLMVESQVDAVLLSVGADLPYFTGYEAMASERLTILVVPPDVRPTLIIPRLEAPRVQSGPQEIVVWDETTDPIELVGNLLREPSTVALGDHTWSVFLIRLQQALGPVSWIPASELTSALRVIKEPLELDQLREAAAAVDRVLARIPDEVRFSGRSESEVAADLARMTVDEGHEMAAFNIVASGPNASSPHHGSGSRVIEDGDLVICDFGGRLKGYFSDVTRTFAVGEPSDAQKEVHAVVEVANRAGREAVAPGVPCGDVDLAARAVIEGAGYGEYFIHRTGHGIGTEVHEHPYVVKGNETPLEVGMTFSIEPGIYLPGRFGVRIEDIVACGEDGAEELNRADRGLVVVG